MGGIVDSIFGGGPDVPDPAEVSAAESKANIEAAGELDMGEDSGAVQRHRLPTGDG